MSSVAAPAVPADVRLRKCLFCAEEILEDAKKCKHCGEFVKAKLSRGVGFIFAAGVVIACVLAGMQAASSDGVLAVGVWSIFVLLFVSVFGR